MFEICLSLSRFVAVAPTCYEDIYREQIRQLSNFSLKLSGGKRDLQMLKVFFFKPFSSQSKATSNREGTQVRNKESVPFFFRLLASLLVLLLGLSKFPFSK
jgi:hypothetical protein